MKVKILIVDDEIEICDYQNIKNGKDFIKANGDILSNKSLTFDPPPIIKYAYCSDTVYFEDIIPIIQNSDMLYHESTFLEDKKELAATTRHSTARQAAKIAQKANVKKLLLGHYSSRYKDENLFLEEATPFFKNTELCFEGKEIEIHSKNMKELN